MTPAVRRPASTWTATRATYSDAERYYWGGDAATSSDDERDEDADGLTNFDEVTGR